jgi:hypothetical protein
MQYWEIIWEHLEYWEIQPFALFAQNEKRVECWWLCTTHTQTTCAGPESARPGARRLLSLLLLYECNQHMPCLQFVAYRAQCCSIYIQHHVWKAYKTLRESCGFYVFLSCHCRFGIPNLPPNIWKLRNPIKYLKSSENIWNIRKHSLLRVLLLQKHEEIRKSNRI